MQQPDHDIRIARTTQATPRRVISLGLVGALHLILVYALVSGLAQTLIQKLPDEFKVATVQDKPDVKPPPPPPPPLEQPPPPFVPPPDIVISSDAPVTNAITTTTVKQEPAPPSVGKPATPRGSRRGCTDLYPSMSQRLKEEGTSQVRFTITADGEVTNATISKASGSDRLDQAALNCITRWHWNPAQNPQGQPMETQTALNIKWVLPK